MTDAPKTPHPQEEANFVSKIILWWIFPLLQKGTGNYLNQEDLHPIRDIENSRQRTDLLDEKWREEILSAKCLGRKPKLWRALFRCYGFQEYWHLVPLGLTSVFGDNITFFATITLLGQLISFYSTGSRGEYYVYIYGITIGCLMRSICLNHLILDLNVLGVRARAAVVGLLYKKLLRSNKVSLSSGHLMELVCNDSHRLITNSTWYIPYAIRHLSMATCAVAWLLYFIGWQIIPGVLFLLALGVLRLLLHDYDYKLRARASHLSEKRLGNIRETLTAMRCVKLNCWETIYEEKIQKSRWQEIKSKVKRWIIMLMSYSFISCGHHLGILITVLVLTLTERGKIPHLNFFAMITLYHELSERLCYNLTTAIRQITSIHAALHRIQGFLEIDDFPNLKNSPENHHHLSTETIPDTIKSTKISSKRSYKSIREQHPYLSLHEVTCELPAQVARLSREKTCTVILNDVSFNVTTPGLVLVCGPVGSGKSSLLATILGGELIVTSGLVKYSGTLAYVSDIPWVFPGTIRENILFGLPYNEKLYAETIRACQLEKDFKEFPQMDLALIGEHGATLSGGQRTRIALARAVYSQADIYLLDDPLSSLDAQVAENVFRHCIRGLLSDKIILLTTHNNRYFHEADLIIHLKDGKIREITADLSLAELEKIEKYTQAEEQKSEHHETTNDPNGLTSGQPLKQESEKREVGRIAFRVYKEYLLYGASAIVLFVFILVFFSGQGIIVLVDVQASRLPVLAGQGEESFNHALLVFTLCLSAGVVLIVLCTLCMFLILMNAAYKIHNKMVSCLLRAPLSFHAVNPVGRILNRFSQDIDNIDELLPFFIFRFSLNVTPGIATIILATMMNFLIIIPIVIALPIFYFFAKVFFTSATDIRRLMSVAGSPIYSHFSNTKEGLRSIRVYGREKEFIDQAFRYIDEHHRAVLCNYTAIRWFACVFSSVCALVAAIVAFIVLHFVTDSTSAALGAVTILYAVTTTQSIDYCVRVIGNINSQMTSAERALAYTKIQPEHGRDLLKKPPDDWPNAGEIEMKDVSLWYYEDSPLALKNLTFKIKSSEKVGIAGRTGAGKSSVVSALMRLAKVQGEIFIDGLNIEDFNMLSTRKCISVISQLPTLVNGTVRLNLDPLGEHTDCEIWAALHRTKMSSSVGNIPHGLDAELNIDNSSFSVGEKQLLNLTRVLLQNNKIVILDEATGKIDGNTNKEIQRIIDEDLKECTVITISHRLSTVLKCDRVMVLDEGEIKEFDCPAVLLGKSSGLLKQLEQMA